MNDGQKYDPYQSPDSDAGLTRKYDPYLLLDDEICNPPKTLWAALRKIGPGIILAGSIVGSGELLLTTSLGAEYGFTFLWLILFSCIVKVFVQIELGRYAISSGKPTLAALNELPGPRILVHWTVWWWFCMLLATVSQLGGMVGGVGQALNLAFPSVTRLYFPGFPAEHPWAILTGMVAIGLLLIGGYKSVERITTVLVASVTLITVLCVIALPAKGYPITLSHLQEGLSFHLPLAGIGLAFSVFGITGVGASELYSYPYWCLEKGYARFAGAQCPDAEWVDRARGWLRVMQLDAWVSMVVFTVATVAFYCLGATVLHSNGLAPKGPEMIRTLAEMYVPVFGDWTRLVFLIGACAVLFKTLYVASASHSRLTTDFFGLAGFLHLRDGNDRRRWIRRFCVFYPSLAVILYFLVRDPRAMVAFGGFAQAVTLPVISGAALFLRYFRTDRRLAPSRLADILLWIAFIAISMVAITAIPDFLNKMQQLMNPS